MRRSMVIAICILVSFVSIKVEAAGDSYDDPVTLNGKSIEVEIPTRNQVDKSLNPVGIIVSRWYAKDGINYVDNIERRGKQKIYIGYNQKIGNKIELRYDNIGYLFEEVDGKDIYRLQVEYVYRTPSNIDIVGRTQNYYYKIGEEEDYGYKAILKVEKLPGGKRVISDVSTGDYSWAEWTWLESERDDLRGDAVPGTSITLEEKPEGFPDKVDLTLRIWKDDKTKKSKDVKIVWDDSEDTIKAEVEVSSLTPKFGEDVRVKNISKRNYEGYKWEVNTSEVSEEEDGFVIHPGDKNTDEYEGTVFSLVRLYVGTEGDGRSSASEFVKIVWGKEGQIDPPIGGGGSGDIQFNPNSTSDIANNLGWVNRNVSVGVSIGGDRYCDVPGSQSRGYTYEEEVPAEDEDDEPTTETKSGTAECSIMVHLDAGDISVSGSASGRFSNNGGNIEVRTDGEFNKLSGKTEEWKVSGVEWTGSAPKGEWDSGAPSESGFIMPATYTGESGFYKIDKINPTVSAIPLNKGWTNIPYTVELRFMDELSGVDPQSSVTVIDNSYYRHNIGNIPSNSSIAGHKGRLSSSNMVNIDTNGMYSAQFNVKDIATNTYSKTFGVYHFDNINPDIVKFKVAGGMVKRRNIPQIGMGFNYISDQTNQINITVGDELSGIADSKYAITKSINPPDIGEMQSLGMVTTEGTKASSSKTINVNTSLPGINDLKEGKWYVHVYTVDRANNVTLTTSEPLYFAKVRSKRIEKITDYSWKGINNINVKDMPVWVKSNGKSVKLGYKVYVSLDTIGFDETSDNIDVSMRYFVLREGNMIEADIYTKDANGGAIKLLQNTKYRSNKSDILNCTGNSIISGAKQNKYGFDVFVPIHSLVVKKGETPKPNRSNLYEEKGDNLLVVMQVSASKVGVGTFNYTKKEDKYSMSDGSSYGKNNPTGESILEYGKFNGETIIFSISDSLQDDMKTYREW